MKTATEIGQATLERLLAQAAANRASGDHLRTEVRAIWQQHPDFSAKRVLKRLTRRPRPSVRRVQEILKDLRAESAAVSERR
jgi:hypothetical protein